MRIFGGPSPTPPVRRAAFLSMDSLDGFVTYDHLAVAPLAARGWRVDEVSWRSGADWGAYEAVVIRTPWDYHEAPEAFLGVLEGIEASRARLANPLGVVRWNLDKRYLRDVDASGAPIVPTLWLDGLTAEALEAAFERFGPELVAKPQVGASAVDTFRLARGADAAPALAALRQRPTMVQGFVPAVADEGEFSLFFFGSAYSHAILKTPASGDFRVQEEHGGRIVGVEPEPALRAAAVRAVRAAAEASGAGPLLYARPDLVRMPDGSWAVMEIELVEPSLYFPYGEGSAERFAEAFVRWMEA